MSIMDLVQAKQIAAGAWILVAGVLGLVANVNSVTAWVLLAAVGFGPPLIMLLLWHTPTPTLSESIQHARPRS